MSPAAGRKMWTLVVTIQGREEKAAGSACQDYMNFRSVQVFGIALPLAAVIIVALVAVVFAFAPGVGAHPCDGTSDDHVDPQGVHCESTTPAHVAGDHPRIWLSVSEGQRGTEFDFQGRGFPRGTVTAFEGDNSIVDEGEILGSDVVTTAAGTFSINDLRAGGRPQDLDYKVWVIDSEGNTGSLTFKITEERISFEPAKAVIGESMTIIIEDWQNALAGDDDGIKGVAAVEIAGKTAFVVGHNDYGETAIKEYATCIDYTGRALADENRVLTMEVTVPRGTLPGMQTVSLYDYDQLELLDSIGSVVSPLIKSPCSSTPEGETLEEEFTAQLLETKRTVIPKSTTELITPEDAVPPQRPPRNDVEVDGVRDQELELRVYPISGDTGINIEGGDIVEITLPEFDLSGAALNSIGLRGKIKIHGSEEASSDGVAPKTVEVNTQARKLTLTLPDSPPVSHGVGEYLVITIEKEAGILAPTTPRGFDDPDYGYPVSISIIDRDTGQPIPGFEDTRDNIVVVNNPLSSWVPSAIVRVELVANAEADIGPGEEIVVDFSGPSDDSEFSVPSSITSTRVTIDPDPADRKNIPIADKATFSPSDVLVQGARVILTIPSGESPKRITEGEFKITFSNLARIRNPSAAGTREILVSSFVQGDLLDRITAVILRTTTIDTLEGPRGTEFTLEGKGYSRGTVTIYEGDDNIIDPGETLASVETVRGAFDVDLVARGEPGDLVYLVRTKDSEGIDDEVEFIIKSGMFFQPSTARVGSPLKITIADWQDPDRDVAAVSIAGETAHLPQVSEYANCFDYTSVFSADAERLLSLEVEVPRHVPGGNQTVAVYDHEQLDHLDEDGNVLDKPACADLAAGQTRGSRRSGDVTVRLKDEPIAIIKDTIEIDTQDVVLTPGTAVRGQRVTITGSGFTRASRGSDHIDSVWIGGLKVRDDHSGFEVGSNGNIAFSVTVPLGVAGGRNEVRLEGTDNTLGQATLTVPEAAITLVPREGQRGTELTVIGTGFIAKEPVILSYHSDAVVTNRTVQLAGSGLLADAQGGFELTIDVPITAEVGKEHLVTAMAEVDARGETASLEAEALHFVTQAEITTAPESVSPGDHLTISGENLPLFTLVGSIRIAGIDVTPATEVATDEEGSFETRVLVPQIEFGDQTLLVQVAGVVIPLIIEVAPPPLSGPPGQVFKEPIKVGALQAVWHYDNATQAWSLFDPNLPEDVSDLNDLDQVTSGDIVWIRLNASMYFQGGLLTEGWKLISLK